MPATEPLHIGNLIKHHLQEQERSVAWLAKAAHCDGATLWRRLQKQSMDSELLYQISAALKVDFHALYSQRMRG